MAGRSLPMSMEAALDEERIEILALLEGKDPKTATTAARGRTTSPTARRQSSSKRKPFKLSDLAPGVPRTEHLQGRNNSDTPPQRSMLDTSISPTTHRTHRLSHGSASPSILPTIQQGLPSPGVNIEDAYRFDMVPSNDIQTLPKRVTQGGKKSSAMADALGNTSARRSSKSPATALRKSQFGVTSPPGTYITGSGQVVDLKNAHEKLSDAALQQAGGSFANLPIRKAGETQNAEDVDEDGNGGRLTKDKKGDDEEDESSSDEDEDEEGEQDSEGSSGEITDDENGKRGRRRQRKESYTEVHPVTGLSTYGGPVIKAPDNKKKLRSMLDVDGNKIHRSRPDIHPRTSFDNNPHSGISTPMDSDEEQVRSDLNTAQKMTLTLSPIHSTPTAHRCIRQLLRGDYRKYQIEAEQGLRRQRMYLVATDVSDEAAYALEWTIGTVLRDGDTLLAVYAVDEESGTGGDPSASTSIGIGEGANQMNDAAAIVRTLSNVEGLVVVGESTGKGSSNGGRSVSHARTSSTDFKSMDRAEKERYQATEQISERCIKLLRKTKLQVRVVVEVFHCKSPKHMITEVIDHLEPTLVILGSRGRSAIKGVLLGSFSNYLVTKSSVPVMVARKKLRKHSKLKRSNLRLSNMLQNPGGRLASAAIEKPSKKR